MIPPGNPKPERSERKRSNHNADEEKESSSARIKAAVLVEAIFSSAAHKAEVLASPARQRESHHGEDVHYSLVLRFPLRSLGVKTWRLRRPPGRQFTLGVLLQNSGFGPMPMLPFSDVVTQGDRSGKGKRIWIIGIESLKRPGSTLDCRAVREGA